MSLQVWLLLDNTKKYTNLGFASDITFTGVSPSSTYGKVTRNAFLGSNPSSNTATKYIKASARAFEYSGNFTASAWIRPSSSNYPQFMFSNGRVDMGGYGYGIYYYSSDKQILARFGNALISASNLQVGSWYHVAMTVDSSKKLSLYVDGVLKASITATTLPTYAEAVGLTIGCFNYVSGAIYQWAGAINDFRLYDEVLSARQIYWLSRGLSLHIKFDLPAPNLFTNSIPEKYFTYSGGSSYLDSNYSQETITPAADSYYTMSFEAKASSEGSYLSTFLYNNNSGRQCDKVEVYRDGELIQTTTRSDGWSGAIPLTTYYQHFTIVRHFNTNSTALTKQNVFRIMGNSSSYTVYLRNAKLEEGAWETALCPYGSKATSYKFSCESDSSGNGWYIDEYPQPPSYQAISPAYGSCAKFSSGDYLYRIADPISTQDEEFTIAFWVKFTDVSATQCIWNGRSVAGGPVAIFLIGGKLRFDTSVQSTYNYTFTTGVWYHIAVTYKLFGYKFLYVNNVIQGSVSAGYIDEKSETYASIGYSSSDSEGLSPSNPFTGYLSDFRIYKKALNSVDIQYLCKIPISLETGNNLYCREVIQL